MKYLISSIKKSLFSVLDLKNGYYHITIRPEDRHKTAFSLPCYKLQFIRILLILKNVNLQ